MDDNLVEIQDLHFRRGRQVIFDGVDLSIPRGKITAIMGPSGTGKTTLLRLIGGQLRPGAGTLRVDGTNVPDLGRAGLYALRRRMGMLFQSGALLTDLNVFENVAFPVREHTKLPEALIRDVPDFPIPGIVFKDITTLLKDHAGLKAVNDLLGERYRDQQIDVVAAIESRGFMFGTPLALELGAGFVPIRKAGKLPADTIHREYALEYGTARLELHRDAVRPGQRVLVIDDVLATGGTAKAGVELIEELGGEVVEVAFVIELAFLPGRKTLAGYDVFSLIRYE